MSSVAIRLDRYGVYDVAAALEAAERLGVSPDVGRSNSYTCPRGREPGVAELLMVAEDLDRIRANVSQRLVIEGDDGSISLAVWMDSARSVFPGDDGNPNELFVVRFLDRRCRLMMRPMAEFARNMRDPDRPDEYLDHTIDGETAWTWAEVVQEVWDELNAGTLAEDGLGAWPGFPAGYTVPADRPENLYWQTTETWDILNDLLDRMGLAVSLDPKTDEYRIVVIGESDAVVSAAERVAFKIDEDRLRLGHQQNVPARVKVMFPRQSAELADTSADTLYEVTAGSDALLTTYGFNADDLDSESRVVLLDDMSAQIEADGTTATNQTDLDARALERATEFYKRLTAGDDFPAGRRKTFSGVVSEIRPGGRIERVTWFCVEDGWKTEYSSSAKGERRKFVPGPAAPQSTTRLVKVIDEGEFHVGGYRVFACRTLVPVFDEMEGASFDFQDFIDGEVIYAGTMENATPSTLKKYFAYFLQGKWMFNPCSPCGDGVPQPLCPCSEQQCYQVTFEGTVVDEDSLYNIDGDAQYVDGDYVMQIDPNILAGVPGFGYCMWSNEFHDTHDTDYDEEDGDVTKSIYLQLPRTGTGDVCYLQMTIKRTWDIVTPPGTWYTVTGRYELNGEFQCGEVNTFTFVAEDFWDSQDPANTEWAEAWPATVTVYPVDCTEAYEPPECGGDCNGNKPNDITLCIYDNAAAPNTIALTCTGPGVWGGSGSISGNGETEGVVAILTCIGGDIYELDINGVTANASLFSYNPMTLFWASQFSMIGDVEVSLVAVGEGDC